MGFSSHPFNEDHYWKYKLEANFSKVSKQSYKEMTNRYNDLKAELSTNKNLTSEQRKSKQREIDRLQPAVDLNTSEVGLNRTYIDYTTIAAGHIDEAIKLGKGVGGEK